MSRNNRNKHSRQLSTLRTKHYKRLQQANYKLVRAKAVQLGDVVYKRNCYSKTIQNSSVYDAIQKKSFVWIVTIADLIFRDFNDVKCFQFGKCVKTLHHGGHLSFAFPLGCPINELHINKLQKRVKYNVKYIAHVPTCYQWFRYSIYFLKFYVLIFFWTAVIVMVMPTAKPSSLLRIFKINGSKKQVHLLDKFVLPASFHTSLCFN